jgi:ubiquinone/menaquinone biosynthesis C-methylase UbiE
MLTYEFIDPEKQISSQNFNLVESFLRATGRTQLGWHYITDIVWIYSQVKDWPRSYRILDAGGGYGAVQFLLAEMGFSVVNIDLSLTKPSKVYRDRYKITHEDLESFSPTSYVDLLNGKTRNNERIKKLIKSSFFYHIWQQKKRSQYVKSHEEWRYSVGMANFPIGNIEWKTGNLCYLPEISSESFDAIISLSSLEHIPYEVLDQAVSEIFRVLKPEAKWAVTTSGTQHSKTWWHEPSQGNCFSTHDLERLFLANKVNDQSPEEVLDKYQQCAYLKNNLADFYKKSGNYGMPWGVWRPTYIPVGLST